MSDIDNSPGPTESNREAQQWGMFAHLSALIGFVIPFGNIVGPLVIWQMKKDDAFIADQGKEALNFQITVTLAVFACLLLSLIVIGMLLLPIVGLAALILTIIGGVKANGGERYRYPFALRLVT